MNSKNKKEKKSFKLDTNTLLIIIGVLIVIIIFALILNHKTSVKDNTIKYTFNENKLIAFSEKDQYGFINTNGKVIVKAQYDYIMDETGKYIVVEKEGRYYLLDENGKEKINSKTSIAYDSKYDTYTADNKLYNSSLKVVSPSKYKVTHSGYGYYRFISEDGETAGVINYQGKVNYKQKITKGASFYIYVGDKDEDQKEVYCAITPDNKAFSIINCDTGKVIMDYTSSMITAGGNNIFYIGTINEPDVKTIYIKNNKIALEVNGKVNFHYYSQGYIEYIEDETMKYYDINNNKILEEEPDELHISTLKTEWEKETNYSKITCTKQYGLISNEKVILPCEYDKIQSLPTRLYKYLKSLGKNYVITTKNNKTQVMDLDSKKEVHSFNTITTINSTSSSPFIYYYQDGGKVTIYNLKNNKEETLEADYVDVYGNYFRIHKDNKLIYYNLNFKKIYEVDNEK